jgi:uroporphyrinogen-III synthase
MAKVLITRPKGSSENLRNKLQASEHELLEIPFIKTELIHFNADLIQEDWIFFSSKNSVQSCIAAGVQLDKFKLATVGNGTSKVLPSSLSISFEGNSTEIEMESKRFASLVGLETVCFPSSDRSLHSFSKHLSSKQVNIIETYKTVLQPSGAPMASVILFSSPSNVEGFLKLNIIMPSQKIIAFGPSTANYLKSQGIAVFKILDSTEEETIFSTIIEAIDSL